MDLQLTKKTRDDDKLEGKGSQHVRWLQTIIHEFKFKIEIRTFSNAYGSKPRILDKKINFYFLWKWNVLWKIKKKVQSDHQLPPQSDTVILLQPWVHEDNEYPTWFPHRAQPNEYAFMAYNEQIEENKHQFE